MSIDTEKPPNRAGSRRSRWLRRGSIAWEAQQRRALLLLVRSSHPPSDQRRDRFAPGSIHAAAPQQL